MKCPRAPRVLESPSGGDSAPGVGRGLRRSGRRGAGQTAEVAFFMVCIASEHAAVVGRAVRSSFRLPGIGSQRRPSPAGLAQAVRRREDHEFLGDPGRKAQLPTPRPRTYTQTAHRAVCPPPPGAPLPTLRRAWNARTIHKGNRNATPSDDDPCLGIAARRLSHACARAVQDQQCASGACFCGPRVQ